MIVKFRLRQQRWHHRVTRLNFHSPIALPHYKAGSYLTFNRSVWIEIVQKLRIVYCTLCKQQLVDQELQQFVDQELQQWSARSLFSPWPCCTCHAAIAEFSHRWQPRDLYAHRCWARSRLSWCQSLCSGIGRSVDRFWSILFDIYIDCRYRSNRRVLITMKYLKVMCHV